MSITNRKNGFSLIETLMASALGAFLAVMVVASLTMGVRGLREIKRTERVRVNAVFLGDTLQYWVKQGVRLELIDSSTLKIVLPDFSSKTIGFVGGEVILDGSPITSDDVEVTALEFTKLSNSVRVSFSLKSKTGGESISLITTSAKRNAL